MIDAYFHLCLEEADPLTDLQLRLRQANLDGAIVVETWAGEERSFLERLSDERVRVIWCWRGSPASPALSVLDREHTLGLRFRTADLPHAKPVLERIASQGKVALVHAEAGIGPLVEQVERVIAVHPRLRVYVPHLGWPAREGKADPAWPAAVRRLVALPRVTFGVSAACAFTAEPFPHADVRDLALTAIQVFDPSRLVAATNYPHLDRARFADYWTLAVNWILSIHSAWRHPDDVFA